MFKQDLEKIGSAVSKHSENIKGFGFSAKNLAENPKKMAGFEPQDPQLFRCMVVASNLLSFEVWELVNALFIIAFLISSANGLCTDMH